MVNLTPRSKHYLKIVGYTDEDIFYIEQADYRYLFDYTSKVDESLAIKRLGRESWLSGIARARFHFSAVRECRLGNSIIYIERVI